MSLPQQLAEMRYISSQQQNGNTLVNRQHEVPKANMPPTMDKNRKYSSQLIHSIKGIKFGEGAVVLTYNQERFQSHAFVKHGSATSKYQSSSHHVEIDSQQGIKRTLTKGRIRRR